MRVADAVVRATTGAIIVLGVLSVLLALMGVPAGVLYTIGTSQAVLLLVAVGAWLTA